MQSLSWYKGVPARWVLPVACTLVGALLGYLASMVVPSTYTGRSELFFTAQGGTSVTEFNDAASLVRSQMTSYAQLVTSQTVLERVAQDVGGGTTPKDLAKELKATVPVDTVVLQIEATAKTPAEAATLANAVATRVSEQATAVSPKASGGASVVRPSIVTRAVPDPERSWPNGSLFAGTGGFVGLLIGCVLAAVLPRRRGADGSAGL